VVRHTKDPQYNIMHASMVQPEGLRPRLYSAQKALYAASSIRPSSSEASESLTW
jgi:hypothetical protein